ncbi:hypothetical protein [Microbacterium sp. E-13]|uniref:hypothetical protein n=1 Tax=Microbacterium sp. E-13 TaxID=3404048 RepID=UPI003CEBD64C
MAIAYNYEGAAEQFGVAVSKIRTAVRENQIAAKYWGKDVLIPHAELERFLESLPEERG